MTSRYIVTFKDSATTEQINGFMKQIQEDGGTIVNRFPDMISRGFSAAITDSVYEKIRSDPQIDHITLDQAYEKSSSVSAPGVSV